MRRLAAMAIELITRPMLLVVEDPSAGLDATQEHHVLATLRRQADLGCVVVVTLTSQASLTQLNMCDQVLLVTPAGVAFAGPPAQIESVIAGADWSQVIAQVTSVRTARRRRPCPNHHRWLNPRRLPWGSP